MASRVKYVFNEGGALFWGPRAIERLKLYHDAYVRPMQPVQQPGETKLQYVGRLVAATKAHPEWNRRQLGMRVYRERRGTQSWKSEYVQLRRGNMVYPRFKAPAQVVEPQEVRAVWAQEGLRQLLDPAGQMEQLEDVQAPVPERPRAQRRVIPRPAGWLDNLRRRGQ